MIDTLMALWNQDRRKRRSKPLLIFLLLCISISLLLCVVHPPDLSRQRGRKTSTGDVDPTATLYQSTVGPNMTPTSTFVIINQATPTVTTPGATPSTATPSTATTPGATPSAGATLIPSTPGATPSTGATLVPSTPVATATTQPCIATPTIPFGKASLVHPDAPVRQGNGGYVGKSTTAATLRPGATSVATLEGTPSTHAGQPGVSAQPHDGGGPIITSSPIPTHALPSTPDAGQNGAAPNTPHGSGGAGSSCLGNNISGATKSDVLEAIEQNIGFILVSSLFGTIAFYGVVYVVRRKQQRA